MHKGYLILIGAIALTLPGVAQAENAPLSYKDIYAPLSGIPTDTPITLSFAPADLVAQCTSNTSLALTLTTPADGVTIAAESNKTETVPFTVSDSEGNMATANVIVTRN